MPKNIRDRDTMTITPEDVDEVRAMRPEDLRELRNANTESPEADSTPANTRTMGYVPDEFNEKDWSARSLFGARRDIPNEATGLESCIASIHDQGLASSCVGHALAGAGDARMRKLGRWNAPLLSSDGIYKFARSLARPSAKNSLIDDGSSPRYAMNGLREWGAPTEASFPSTYETINEELDWAALREASTISMGGFWRIDALGKGGIEEMCQAIAAGYPVPFGIITDRAFHDLAGKDAKKPLGAINQDELVGGHMMFAFAYYTENGRRKIRCVNSWGVTWGDFGTFTADEDFFLYVKDRYVLHLG
jgi:hypothetical protein